MNKRSYQLALLVTLASMVNCTFSGAQQIPGADPDGAPNDQTVDAAPTPDAQNIDRDSDGVENASDNCPDIANPMQWNEDGDDYGNRCDVCPHIADNDQADSDNDGVGDSCDPQPGAINSWLYFNGFDQALVTDDWVGEGGFNVSGGALHSVDNAGRYLIRNTTFNHGDDVMVISAITFSNLSTNNNDRYKYGGLQVRAGTDQRSNSCWILLDQFRSRQGYSFIESNRGGTLDDKSFVEMTIPNTEHIISATVHGRDYLCNFQPLGESAISLAYTTEVNRNETTFGLISSYADFEAKYLLAISLQPPSEGE